VGAASHNLCGPPHTIRSEGAITRQKRHGTFDALGQSRRRLLYNEMELLMRAHLFSALTISGFAVAHATTALAWDVGTTCGSSPPNWDAPKGAVVSLSSSGPIRSIINALGEVRTHTILSQGNGWASHATTAQPSRNGDGCPFSPITPSELAHGYPGFTTVNLGGIYTFVNGATFLNYQTPTVQQPSDFEGAQAVSDFVWDWSPRPNNNFSWQWNGKFYTLGQTLWNGRFQNYFYEFNQYMNARGRLDGDVAAGPGVVCTTAIGYAYANWRFYDNPSFPRGNIPRHDYSKQQTVSAGNALWNAINDMCLNGLSWDERNLDWLANCNSGDACQRAAWQTLNCFFSGPNVNGACDGPTSGNWTGYVNDNSQQNNYGAYSLSPDGLLGWSGLPTNDSLWAPYVDHPVQWSGEGNVYGCWF
jgi:hypothetical protein